MQSAKPCPSLPWFLYLNSLVNYKQGIFPWLLCVLSGFSKVLPLNFFKLHALLNSFRINYD